MREKRTTILSIGERADFDSFLKFHDQSDRLKKQGFNYRSLSFKRLFRENPPAVKDKKVIVFMFFPLHHWNQHIEHKKYRGLYGNITFHNKFMQFGKKVSKRLNKIVIADKVILINDPRRASHYRDKKVMKRTLSTKGVNVPRVIKRASIKRIEQLLKKEKKVFIKPRCGSMGKGITYLEKDKWLTNFNIRNDRATNIHSDYGWVFKDVTGNKVFLGKLLDKDMIVEEAVSPLRVKGRIVDFRVYAFLDKILYIYPRKGKVGSITTNISQGAKGSPDIRCFLSRKTTEKIEKQVLLTMKALRLNFAGVDVMLNENKKKAYVIDVNMFPGFPKVKTYNLPRSMITRLSEYH